MKFIIILISAILSIDLAFCSKCGVPGSENNSTIVMVQVLFRHGQRAPTGPYPTDPLTNETKYWPNGFGQLTDFGKEQNYQLGKLFRQRYPTIIKQCFHVRDLIATCTDFDRVIMSAQLVLAGMYPVKHGCLCTDGNNEDYEYEELHYQPVPVHVLTGDGSNRLMLNNTAYSRDPAVCPRYKQIYDNLASNPILNQTYLENQEFINFFYNQSGITSQFTSNAWWSPLFNTAANIQYESYPNYPIPQWAQEIIDSPTKMEFLSGLLRFGAITEEMQRLVGGPLIKDFIQNMLNKINGTETKSFFLLSAHGHNLVNVLSAFGLYDPPIATNDASAIIVELHLNNSQYIVKTFYREGLSETMNPLVIPGCSEPCTVAGFQTALGNVIPANLTAACQL